MSDAMWVLFVCIELWLGNLDRPGDQTDLMYWEQ